MELATTECLQKELQVQKRVMPVLDLPQPKVTIRLPICIMFVWKLKVKVTAILIQSWTDPQGSWTLRLTGFVDRRHMKVTR